MHGVLPDWNNHITRFDHYTGTRGPFASRPLRSHYQASPSRLTSLPV